MNSRASPSPSSGRIAQRRQRILDALALPLPLDGMQQGGAEDHFAAPEERQRFEAFFRAFGVALPDPVRLKTLIAAWLYLGGRIGAKFKLLLSDPRLFDITKSSLRAEEVDYLQALAQADDMRIALCVARMNIFAIDGDEAD